MIAAASRAWLAVCAAVALTISTAYAESPALSFKGIEFGKSGPEDVLAKFPGSKQYGPAVIATPSSAAPVQLFRIGQTSAGDFIFTVLDGSIADLSATFTSDSFPAVVAAFREKYGDPTSTESGTVKNRAGGTFSNQVVTWKLTDGEIVARERSGKVTSMSLSISTHKFIAKTRDEAKKSVKDAAKDL